MIQEQRINSLRRILSSDSQAALVTNETNVYYFSGIRNSEGKILLFKDEVYLLVDFRYSETARNNCKSCKVFEFRNLREDIKELMTKHGAKALYIENEDVTLSAYNSYVEYFSQFGIEIMNENALSKAITNLRLIKSEEEIEYIAEAQRITEKAYTEVLNFVKPGVTERKVALELEYLMKQYGASHVSFDLITITGKKTSLPHGVPSDGIIAEGDFFTMDIGALYNGYHSDMTRTVAVKSCSDYQRDKSLLCVVLCLFNCARYHHGSGLRKGIRSFHRSRSRSIYPRGTLFKHKGRGYPFRKYGHHGRAGNLS